MFVKSITRILAIEKNNSNNLWQNCITFFSWLRVNLLFTLTTMNFNVIVVLLLYYLFKIHGVPLIAVSPDCLILFQKSHTAVCT